MLEELVLHSQTKPNLLEDHNGELIKFKGRELLAVEKIIENPNIFEYNGANGKTGDSIFMEWFDSVLSLFSATKAIWFKDQYIVPNLAFIYALEKLSSSEKTEIFNFSRKFIDTHYGITSRMSVSSVNELNLNKYWENHREDIERLFLSALEQGIKVMCAQIFTAYWKKDTLTPVNPNEKQLLKTTAARELQNQKILATIVRSYFDFCSRIIAVCHTHEVSLKITFDLLKQAYLWPSIQEIIVNSRLTPDIILKEFSEAPGFAAKRIIQYPEKQNFILHKLNGFWGSHRTYRFFYIVLRSRDQDQLGQILENALIIYNFLENHYIRQGYSQTSIKDACLEVASQDHTIQNPQIHELLQKTRLLHKTRKLGENPGLDAQADFLKKKSPVELNQHIKTEVLPKALQRQEYLETIAQSDPEFYQKIAEYVRQKRQQRLEKRATSAPNPNYAILGKFIQKTQLELYQKSATYRRRVERAKQKAIEDQISNSIHDFVAKYNSVLKIPDSVFKKILQGHIRFNYNQYQNLFNKKIILQSNKERIDYGSFKNVINNLLEIAVSYLFFYTNTPILKNTGELQQLSKVPDAQFWSNLKIVTEIVEGILDELISNLNAKNGKQPAHSVNNSLNFKRSVDYEYIDIDDLTATVILQSHYALQEQKKEQSGIDFPDKKLVSFDSQINSYGESYERQDWHKDTTYAPQVQEDKLELIEHIISKLRFEDVHKASPEIFHADISKERFDPLKQAILNTFSFIISYLEENGDLDEDMNFNNLLPIFSMELGLDVEMVTQFWNVVVELKGEELKEILK